MTGILSVLSVLAPSHPDTFHSFHSGSITSLSLSCELLFSSTCFRSTGSIASRNLVQHYVPVVYLFDPIIVLCDPIIILNAKSWRVSWKRDKVLISNIRSISIVQVHADIQVRGHCSHHQPWWKLSFPVHLCLTQATITPLIGGILSWMFSILFITAVPTTYHNMGTIFWT